MPRRQNGRSLRSNIRYPSSNPMCSVSSLPSNAGANWNRLLRKTTFPSSNWVWPDDTSGFAAVTFTFSFDLTGYNLATASLNGLWGIDNIGSVALNGNILSTLPNVVVGNFSSLTAYIANSAALFNQGLNSLVFSVSNQGGPGAFRATGTVTADPSAVPMPAALPLLASSLGALSFLRWRTKRKAAKVSA